MTRCRTSLKAAEDGELNSDSIGHGKPITLNRPSGKCAKGRGTCVFGIVIGEGDLGRATNEIDVALFVSCGILSSFQVDYRIVPYR